VNQLDLFAINTYGDPDPDYVPALDRSGRLWRIKLIQPSTGYGSAIYDEPGSTAVPGAGYDLRWAAKEYGPFKRITNTHLLAHTPLCERLPDRPAPGASVEITSGMFKGRRGVVADASLPVASDRVRVQIPGVGTPSPLLSDVRPTAA
jgi:hypothetical protein